MYPTITLIHGNALIKCILNCITESPIADIIKPMHAQCTIAHM